ncbi:MAG: hypothetical protein ACE5IM_07815, partial [Nitrospinota bacterium]
MDLCECEHCRSVLSPAAYFTDALHFLSQRASKNPGKSAKDILFERRPDLGEIELTCQNTNTLLPYVDLVNEILEEAVSPGTGPLPRDRQTRATEAELAANPEHTKPGAYDPLREAVFPGRLPFDLWTEEARIYLDHLGVSRADLMKTFQKPGPAPSDAAIAAERLGLTLAERLIVTAQYAALEPGSPPEKWEFWGYPKVGPGPWVAETSNLRTFMKKAALTYDETIEILKTRFINPDGSLQIVPEPGAPEHTCDTSKLVIDNIDDNALDRVQRFVRLWRRLGWTVPELDGAVTLLQSAEPDVNKRINDAFLIKLAHIRRLKEAWKQSVEGLVVFWASIDTYGDDPQYRRLFQNPAITKPVDPDFALAGGELAIVAANPANAKISTHVPTVLAALAMTAQELAVLTETVVTDDALTLANLSALYHHVLAARALKMTVRDVVVLKDLSGVDPFDAADTGKALRFEELAGKIRSARTTVAGLDYLLRHKIAAASGLGPSEESQGVILDQIRAGLARITSENALPEDPAKITEVFLKERLSVILEEAAVEKAIALVVDEDWTDTAAKNALIDDHLASFLDTADAKVKLVGPPPALPYDDVGDRVTYVLEPLLKHVKRTQSEAFVKQTVADALGLEAEAGANLLTRWVNAVTDPTKKALEEFLDPAFADSDPETQPITSVNFPNAFKLLTRLEKIASLVNHFKMTTAQLTWVFDEAAAAGWLNPRDLPADAAEPAASFEAWERLANL